MPGSTLARTTRPEGALNKPSEIVTAPPRRAIVCPGATRNPAGLSRNCCSVAIAAAKASASNRAIGTAPRSLPGTRSGLTPGLMPGLISGPITSMAPVVAPNCNPTGALWVKRGGKSEAIAPVPNHDPSANCTAAAVVPTKDPPIANCASGPIIIPAGFNKNTSAVPFARKIPCSCDTDPPVTRLKILATAADELNHTSPPRGIEKV